MRILYGVVGEGMGHAIRSRVVIDHLVQSHDVHVVVSGRAHDYLAKRVTPRLSVSEIWGLSIVYEDNEVRNFRTVLRNVGQALKGGWPKNLKKYFDLVLEFAPDVVITDFETWSYLFAVNHRLPVISLDNMQVINRCKHPPELLKGRRSDFEVARALVKMKVPGCNWYLITSFFEALIKRKRTSIVPSILRPEVIEAKPEAGDHLLVYQTSTTFEGLPDLLRQTGLECRIYGLRRDLTEDAVDGNLRFRPFSNDGFIEDLRTARAVLAGGGFTLMSEAVYLRKPMLAIPVGRQFEQILNSRYLTYEGYGQCVESHEDLGPEMVGTFLERIPDFERALQGYTQDGNSETFAALDEQLAKVEERPKPPPVDL